MGVAGSRFGGYTIVSHESAKTRYHHGALVSKGEIAMFGAIWTVALTAALAQALAPHPPREDQSQPKLLAKGKDYFLHALPPIEGWQSHEVKMRLGHLFQPALRGLVLLHTSTATGEMKVLTASTMQVIPVVRNNPPNDYILSYILGVAADKERLFVLQWTNPQPYQGSLRGTYRLLVFRPGDGVLVRSLELKDDDVPTKPPKETADPGPLRLHGDGVACFGTRFTFKGTELIKQSADKKP
jgi:hypothetical protein